MKINIIGPSGSGKTTLSKKLSQTLNIEPINLDYVFFRHAKDKQREEITEKEWRQNLNSKLKTNNWIIEGVNPIIEVMDNADLIIYLRPSLKTALFRQWKRYVTDPKQRKEHGFKNNLKLSQYLVKQYKEEDDPEKYEDLKYVRVRKLDKLTEKYKNKVKILSNNSAIKKFLREIYANLN